MTLTAAAAAAAVGAGTAYGSIRVLEAGQSDLPMWLRTNYAGQEVNLFGGPALVVGILTGCCLARTDRRYRSAVAAASMIAGAIGAYDDLHGDTSARGLRGHLGALAEGRVTSGAAKIGGLTAAGLVAASLLRRRPIDALLTAGVVAGGANVANLFDVRPGRTLKVGLLTGTTALTGPAAAPAAVALGAATALLPADLHERTMLGDAGAGALGAAVATAVAAGADRKKLRRLLGGLATLTLASEVVSFSRVIDAVPPLRWFDRLGRRPTDPASEP